VSERPNDVIRRNVFDSFPRLYQFPQNLGMHSVLMVFSDYVYKAPSTRELNKIGSSSYTAQELSSIDAVLLPLPTNIQETFSLRVAGIDQGIGGVGVSTGASQFAGAGDLTFNQVMQSLKGALPDVNWDQIIRPNIEEASKNIAFLGRRTFDSLPFNAGRNLDIGLGNTVNPKAALHFDGMNLKQFDFRWNLAPSNKEESDIIKYISNLIRRRTLPSYGDAVGLSRVLLNYPSTVDIFFLGIDQSYFIYFKTCMVVQSSFSYTPNGLAFVTGGKPAMVSVDLQFFEMDIHTSRDYGGADTINPSIREPAPPLPTGGGPG
jgi:hypothetical protein